MQENEEKKENNVHSDIEQHTENIISSIPPNDLNDLEAITHSPIYNNPTIHDNNNHVFSIINDITNAIKLNNKEIKQHFESFKYDKTTLLSIKREKFISDFINSTNNTASIQNINILYHSLINQIKNNFVSNNCDVKSTKTIYVLRSLLFFLLFRLKRINKWNIP